VAVNAMVEAPAKLKVFLKQRMKWLRGYTQALTKHIGMLKDPNRHTLDACLTLIFPLMLVLGLVGYVGALYSVFQEPTNIPILQIIGIALVIFNLLIPTLLVSSNPRNAIYVPLIYLDWILLAAVSLYVHVLALFGKTQKWTRTPKTGHVTVRVG
jgi:cellulose synthase/poly-beta-1,6-N-acetylglucosamine synthase-like glycosyltransferase